MTPDELTVLAETASAHRMPTPGFERSRRRGVTLVREAVSSTATNSAHVRRLDDVSREVADVRSWFSARGCETFTWWIGSAAEPHDLDARLTERGAAVYEPEPLLRAMVLSSEPAAADEVEVREVRSSDEFTLAVDIQCRAFAVPADEREQALAGAADRWRQLTSTPAPRYVAYLEGEPVATAGMERLETGQAFLLSGCVVPEARARGVYRALVHRRWADARARGWLPLIVQAGQMSAPILERCGFQTVGEIRLFEDRSARVLASST